MNHRIGVGFSFPPLILGSSKKEKKVIKKTCFFCVLFVYIIGLNYRLKAARSNTTVVAFVVMPAATHSFNVEALKGQAVTKQLRETVNDVQDRIGRKIYEKALR